MAVDGSANNDDNSGTAAGGQTRVALESVQEFQVITNQFDAEFGRATGAVVNSITKRGTNEFTGALFNYYTNDGMTAKDYFVARNDALPKPETSKREFGGVIGGPILQDRMHFFFSLERQLVAPGRTPVFPDVRSDLNYSTTESWEAWNSLIRVDHQSTPTTPGRSAGSASWRRSTTCWAAEPRRGRRCRTRPTTTRPTSGAGPASSATRR